MSRIKVSGSCHKCNKYTMYYTDESRAEFNDAGEAVPTCGGCQKSRGGNDPTFGGGSIVVPSLKGRSTDYRAALKLEREASQLPVGSEERKELKDEAKRRREAQAKRKLTATEKEDMHNFKKHGAPTGD